jgi:hypothetical protein
MEGMLIIIILEFEKRKIKRREGEGSEGRQQLVIISAQAIVGCDKTVNRCRTFVYTAFRHYTLSLSSLLETIDG